MKANIGRPKEFKQPEVIKEARDVFWKYGYGNVSTQHLCEVTNLGKGSLYNTFKNKHNLFTLSLKQYVEEGNMIQRECILGKSTMKEGISALLDWAISVDFNEENTSGCFMINSYLERGNIDSDVSKLMKYHMDTFNELITDGLEKAKENGELAEGTLSTAEIKEHFLTDYFGFRLMNVITQESRDSAERRKETIIKAFFK